MWHCESGSALRNDRRMTALAALRWSNPGMVSWLPAVSGDLSLTRFEVVAISIWDAHSMARTKAQSCLRAQRRQRDAGRRT